MTRWNGHWWWWGPSWEWKVPWCSSSKGLGKTTILQLPDPSRSQVGFQAKNPVWDMLRTLTSIVQRQHLIFSPWLLQVKLEEVSLKPWKATVKWSQESARWTHGLTLYTTASYAQLHSQLLKDGIYYYRMSWWLPTISFPKRWKKQQGGHLSWTWSSPAQRRTDWWSGSTHRGKVSYHISH